VALIAVIALFVMLGGNEEPSKPGAKRPNQLARNTEVPRASEPPVERPADPFAEAPPAESRRETPRSEPPARSEPPPPARTDAGQRSTRNDRSEPEQYEPPASTGRSENSGSGVYPYVLKSATFIVALGETTPQGIRIGAGSGSQARPGRPSSSFPSIRMESSSSRRTASCGNSRTGRT
jgi:hypothetical protein